MTTLEALLERTGCVKDLAPRPRNWEQLMTAVAAGAIDHDDIEEIALECAALADRAARRCPSWDEAVAKALSDVTGDAESEAGRTLIGCGIVADGWLRSTAAGQHGG